MLDRELSYFDGPWIKVSDLSDAQLAYELATWDQGECLEGLTAEQWRERLLIEVEIRKLQHLA